MLASFWRAFCYYCDVVGIREVRPFSSNGRVQFCFLAYTDSKML